MTEAEAIRRFESVGLLVEALAPSFRRNGYAVIDPVRLPDGSIEGPGIPFWQMTYFWPEGTDWVWESKLVVPGPGPRHRYHHLSELVEALLQQYEAYREANPAERGAAADGGRDPDS
jgi:hypothetical protein